MDITDRALLGEYSGSKVAALFETAEQAGDVANALRTQLALEQAQVLVIAPGDPNPGRKLEPESRGILATIIKAHLILGIVGLLVGLIAWALLSWIQTPFVTNSRVLSLVVFAGFGITLGLFAGGLVALRPDHDPLLFKMKAGLAEGRAVVVVHPFDAGEKSRAEQMLARYGGEVVATL